MDEFFANNVVITGSKIGSATLSNESFSFSFANQEALSGNWDEGFGFTATASFTSSATVPEPATMCLLGLGTLSLLRRKNNNKCNQQIVKREVL